MLLVCRGESRSGRPWVPYSVKWSPSAHTYMRLCGIATRGCLHFTEGKLRHREVENRVRDRELAGRRAGAQTRAAKFRICAHKHHVMLFLGTFPGGSLWALVHFEFLHLYVKVSVYTSLLSSTISLHFHSPCLLICCRSLDLGLRNQNKEAC